MKYCFLLLIIAAVCANGLKAQQTHFVYFDFNKSTIPSGINDSLKAWFANQSLPISIFITGHTDTSGSRKYNQALSVRRANAVAKALRLLYDSCTFQVASFGESKPASSKDQALNRRVEITWTIITKAADSTQKTNNYLPHDTISTKGELLKIPALGKIYFIPDKAVIEASSLTYVQELANVLRNYPVKAVFEIRGHANAPGTKFNKLSEDRAREIYLHLIDLGVPASQLRYLGMGNRQMIFPHPKNEIESRKNIRVDIVVF